MKLTAKLALSQIKTNRGRSVMTLLGICLSSAMLTAVCGFVASAKAVLDKALDYEYDNGNYNSTIIIMGVVLGSIIIAASVIVVSNAFRVSAGERTRQFGILKSVGATKKQIAASVLYEGIFLSAIGIPVGIAAGLLIDLVGVSILTNLLHSMSSGGTLNVVSEEFLTVPFAAPPVMFIAAIVTSFGTVLLSAWLPARKAAKIPSIDAIRNSGEVKMKSKSVRTSGLTQKIFGFEGALAAKSLKRSRRSFRATVVSLTISIVLLISAGSFGKQMERSTTVMFENIDANAVADWVSDTQTTYGEQGEVLSIDYNPISSASAEAVAGKLRDYGGAEIYGVGGIGRYATKLPDSTGTTSALISVDKKHYGELCKTAGVAVGSNILINLRRENENGIKKEYAPYNFSELKGKPLTFLLPGHEPAEVIINGEIKGRQISDEIINLLSRFGYAFAVIVPECESASYTWFAKVDDIAGFVEYAEQLMNEFKPQSADEIGVSIDCYDVSSVTDQLRDLVNTIMVFVYGFVIMLTLIAVTSVISTINTNVRSRAREFAALESVGMTKSGVKKMLNLESILCSIRSLMFGLPLGLAGAYALYWGMGFSVGLSFAFPWLPVIECVFGVFAVTWITMRYSAGRLKTGSIVETIRGE